MRPLAAALMVALSGCGGGQPTANGRWAGTVTPTTQGTLCVKSRGGADIAGGRIMFTPDEGTWVLTGSAEPDGTVTAEKIQLGANKQPYETRLEGKWAPTTLTGTYTTPRCKFDVVLARMR